MSETLRHDFEEKGMNDTSCITIQGGLLGSNLPPRCPMSNFFLSEKFPKIVVVYFQENKKRRRSRKGTVSLYIYDDNE